MNESASAGPRAPADAPKRATAWLSEGFEELLYEHAKKPREYDVVIVGSGYGGAVAAAKLAGRTDNGREIRLCVLERGNEYLPGMFPSRLADLAGHIRFSTPNSARPGGVREGLFDVRVGPDVCALVANGLGGGSLINAGVMAEPSDVVFGDEFWPAEFRNKSERDALYAGAREMLYVAGTPTPDSTGGHPVAEPLKFQALKSLACGNPFRPASITVAMKGGDNRAGVALKECKSCGDCATGCNYGAKDSLDVNLLVEARRRRAEIYTGATVLRIERDRHSERWLLTVVYTDEKLRKRQGAPLKLGARKVILAAGTFGSTEILLRSRSDELGFSARLGRRFSSNGDMIAVAYKQTTKVNAVADESESPDKREVGPTITGIIDLRGPGQPGLVIEELAIPGALRRAFEEVVTSSNALHELAERDDTRHEPGRPESDPLAVDAGAIANCSVLAIMGHDGADGSFELIGGGEGDDDGDGAVRVRWQELRNHDLFKKQIDSLEALAAKSGIGGRILPNPLWQLLPGRMKSLLDNKRGPPFTVHPLGGCPMGRDAIQGVVNYDGQVFKPPSVSGAADVHEDLVVLDGSIVPTSLGINPALTIAALALRAVERLSSAWQLAGAGGPGIALQPRPDFRPRTQYAPKADEPRKTEVEFTERMWGRAVLTAKDGSAIPYIVELTLPFERLPLENLMLPAGSKQVPLQRTLEVCEGDPARNGELRVFDEDHWNLLREHGAWDEELDKQALLRARLRGKLTFWQREKNTCRQRTCTAMRAYLLNRGIRDLWQWLGDRFARLGPARFLGGSDSDPDADPLVRPLFSALAQMSTDTRALASRAGEVRRLEYWLTIDQILMNTELDLKQQTEIYGFKRLTYGRRSNPWRQLTQMTLCKFPGLRLQSVLKLDTKFLARKRIPLFCIVGQHDQPSAIADLVSFFAYFFRLLVTMHLWSFRRPETPEPREPQRLPGIIEGKLAFLRRPLGLTRLPRPSIEEIEIDQLPNGAPVHVRLTRYRPANARGLPLVMIHGYSASGTTFAHHAVRPNMAEYFCRKKKRDVWILDLRTSSGMPTARYPWTFEDAAMADLPAAFFRIHDETGKKLDVVAHCMGAAMLSMVVLKAPVPGDKFFRERLVLPDLINRAVLSQIGPVVVMSPGNAFRAYVLSYLRHFLPLADYDFRVKPDPGLVDQLIDRALASMPYPEEEFDIENPVWPCSRTPFVGTRHRMDALYGRDFNLAGKNGEARLNDGVLKYIDDLFGPLSIDTVSQGIHFARLKSVATPAGRNEYAQAENMRTRWKFPTLSVHGEDNGLADVATLARIQDVLARYASAPIRTHRFPGFGHQDSLIGKDAKQVFVTIAQYLDEEQP